jgi:adenylate cyclase
VDLISQYFYIGGDKKLRATFRMKNWIRRIFKPQIIQEWTAVWREKGLRGLVKEKGWKIVAAVFLFYLIRDSVIYLLLPYLAARGILGC